jgi:hypothetical protein
MLEPTIGLEPMTCRLRNSSAPRKLLKDLGCISTLWGIENRFGRKMCNTLCNGRLDYIARQPCSA